MPEDRADRGIQSDLGRSLPSSLFFQKERRSPVILSGARASARREGPAFGCREGPAFGCREGPAFGCREGPASGCREGPAFGCRESPVWGNNQARAPSVQLEEPQQP